ncbi:type IV toxin-antitoxin system AbiEi family antitoxin domain-containing protein [Faecalibacterium prausnitzii]|uniref:type IV toxin-antitoxin system AbiEi family antitoxin domain-containing protein n=1 Tax=Faecalibacterium prausnitzii TaxID=853 RepID=UPI001650F662|nr:type IV toxin-antitoxin system AbiEi family antitoxin domain-containing protein [Faecalibacterium prausnitzii]
MMNMNNLAQTHEILTPQLATKVGLTKFEFYKYVKANEYEQVRHGVYAAKDTWIDELEMLHRRCPMGVFSHDEAFYYYGLTDREPLVHTLTIATVYKGNIIKNLIMDCQSYTKYRPNETTGGIFVSWRRKEELPTGA